MYMIQIDNTKRRCTNLHMIQIVIQIIAKKNLQSLYYSEVQYSNSRVNKLPVKLLLIIILLKAHQN